MKRIMEFKVSILIVLLHLGMVLYFSRIIGADQQIPRQWGFSGEVSSYGSRAFGLWFLWGMNLFLQLAFILFPYYSVRYKNHSEKFDAILPRLTSLLAFFLMLMHIYQLLWVVELPLIRSFNFIFIIIGMMFMLLGNILPKIPSNFYAGVRSPWTLSSDSNWFRTHRVAGYCFVLGGLMMIIRGLVNLSSIVGAIFLVLTFSVLLYPYLYSYLIYIKESDVVKRRKKDEN